MSDYPMLISNKLHSFRNFVSQRYYIDGKKQHFFMNFVAIFVIFTR